MKHLNKLVLSILLGMSVLSLPTVASELERLDEPQQPKYKASVAVLVDYVATPEGMWGVTFAPRHFDPAYSSWGYYIGYAKGQKTDIAVPEPAESFMKEYMWRFGLSYSLTKDLSIYGGATAYTYETHYTNNIVHPIEGPGGEPTWEKNRDRDWGAEFGLRYNVYQGFTLGAGYDTRNKAGVFSIGLAM
ncbi:porin family protein [Shewanella gaetbuli]|uniref:Porin family protein n=1 Tax=Shewanella gaetbuli TaxID=220752 RepID=A0A9X2CLM4_9GAMM|nr:porin family protein [Shewanella gaetbuli]MCL1142730.1 porin family protein [Shewanella gaetbuli]